MGKGRGYQSDLYIEDEAVMFTQARIDASLYEAARALSSLDPMKYAAHQARFPGGAVWQYFGPGVVVRCVTVAELKEAEPDHPLIK